MKDKGAREPNGDGRNDPTEASRPKGKGSSHKRPNGDG